MVKLTKNQLKELIRQSIKEIDFKDQAAFDAYNKKHKMRKSTKVNVAGKDTTAGDAEKKDKKSTKDIEKQTMSAADAESLAKLVIEKDYKVVTQALIDESKIPNFVAMIDSLIYGTARTTAAGASKLLGEEVERERLSSSGLMDYAGDAIQQTFKGLTQ